MVAVIRNTDTPTRNLAALNKLVVNLDSDIGWQSEAQACVLARLGNDGGIDTDHLSLHVDQGTTAVARIDGRIRLDEALELLNVAANVFTALGADDACRHGMIQVEGTSNGENPIADLHGVGVAHLCDGQVVADINFDDSQIGLAVAADQLRLMLGFVVKPNHDLGGLVDNMMVGHNVAGLVHDETRTEIPGFVVPILIIGPTKEIEEIEWVRRGAPVLIE